MGIIKIDIYIYILVIRLNHSKLNDQAIILSFLVCLFIIIYKYIKHI